jgi:hypothetical protein
VLENPFKNFPQPSNSWLVTPTSGSYKEGGRQGVLPWGRRPCNKNPAAARRRENSERGSQAGPRAARRAPSNKIPQNYCQYILGEPIALNQAMRPKKGNALELWGARPLSG